MSGSGAPDPPVVGTGTRTTTDQAGKPAGSPSSARFAVAVTVAVPGAPSVVPPFVPVGGVASARTIRPPFASSRSSAAPAVLAVVVAVWTRDSSETETMTAPPLAGPVRIGARMATR